MRYYQMEIVGEGVGPLGTLDEMIIGLKAEIEVIMDGEGENLFEIKIHSKDLTVKEYNELPEWEGW